MLDLNKITLVHVLTVCSACAAFYPRTTWALLPKTTRKWYTGLLDTHLHLLKINLYDNQDSIVAHHFDHNRNICLRPGYHNPGRFSYGWHGGYDGKWYIFFYQPRHNRRFTDLGFLFLRTIPRRHIIPQSNYICRQPTVSRCYIFLMWRGVWVFCMLIRLY